MTNVFADDKLDLKSEERQFVTILSINKTTGRWAHYALFLCGHVLSKKVYMGCKIKKFFSEYKLLLRSVPAVVTVFFVISVFSMNLLANKSIDLPVSWLALDCGIIVSWFAFLTMDIVTKHFGPKAATMLSVFAIAVNLVFCLIMFLGSLIPGAWGESFVEQGGEQINGALDNTFGGTWYVLAGSTLAFIVSALVNNFTNAGIGLAFRKSPDGAVAYFLRSYVSTALGQFVDNMIFALVVSHVFFGWSLLQCVTCSLTGMVVELTCEIVFSGFGYAVCRRWKKEDVGREYFEFTKRTKECRQ